MISLFYLAAIAGMFGHWYVVWSEKRTESSFVDWLTKNKVATFKTLVVVFSAITASIALGEFVEIDLIKLGLAYTVGYTADSKFNTDK